jgi:hypothetical protein
MRSRFALISTYVAVHRFRIWERRFDEIEFGVNRSPEEDG